MLAKLNPRNWYREENGQGLIFGALAFFILTLAVLMIVDVGKVTRESIKTQNAADAAAYSGGLVQANCLSSIAWMNDGMAYIYYQLMRYAVDVNVYGTYTLMAETGPPLPPADILPIANPRQSYQEAYVRAQTWIPRGQQWLSDIYKVESSIALCAPVMIKKEIYRVAMENGAERVSIFPDFTFFPDPSSYLRLDITEVPDGYIIVSNTGYSVEVHRTGPDIWTITSSLNINITITKRSDDEYVINNNGTDMIVRRNGDFWVMNSPDLDVSVTQHDGYFTVSGPNGTANLRWSGGVLQQGGPPNWVDVQRPDQYTFGDPPQQIGVYNSNTINIGGANITLGNPPTVGFSNTTITLSDPIAITVNIANANIRIIDGQIWVNGVNAQTQADGLWHTREGIWRYRMTPTGPGQWCYELTKAASYLLPEGNWERFGNMHAVNDNGPLPDWFNAGTGRIRAQDAFYVTRDCWVDRADHTGCTVCRNGDFNNDDRPDVTRFVGEVERFLNQPPYNSIPIGSFPPPLVLSEEYFKYGLNVAVYRSSQGTTNFPGLGFQNPSWGYFKVASCRVGFLDEVTGEWLFAFANKGERSLWVQRSFANLYEPSWRPSLFSSRAQIKSEDIDADPDAAFEEGVNYLWNGLIDTYWRSTYNGAPDGSIGPRIRSSRIDYRSLELQNVVRH